MGKMDTAPPVNEFTVSLALPDDCLALYHVWYLGRNALPLNQNRPDWLYVCGEVEYTSATQF